MRQTQLAGTARFVCTTTDDEAQRDGTMTILQGVQSIFNVVTIEGLGQGKVKFDSDGSFKGTWALNDQICDVSGQAKGNQTTWNGTFTIRHVQTSTIIAQGSFNVEKTSR